MIGLSSSWGGAQGMGIYESVKRIAGLGFKLIELGANHGYEEDIPATLRKIKRDFPGKQFTIHGYFPPISRDRVWVNPCLGLTALNRKILAKSFEAAKMVDALVVGFHPGYLTIAETGGYESKVIKGMYEFNTKGKIERKEGYANALKFYKLGLELSAESGIPFAVENVPFDYEPIFQTQKDYEDLLEKLPKLKLLYDIGHAQLVFPDPLWPLKYPSRIGEVHISDADVHDHMPLGTGKVKFKEILSQKSLKNVPCVFEYGADVDEKELVRERKMVEGLQA